MQKTKLIEDTSKKQASIAYPLLSVSSIFLHICPIELKEANKFIVALHRHHKEVQGHKFSIGCIHGKELVGVAVCGRPISRHLDTGLILEVTRVCTDGTKNACSKLYAACARIARAMGYDKIQTYILESETGASLKASGWECEQRGVGGKAWNSSGRMIRTDTTINLFDEQKKYPNEMKQRWIKKLNCR
jgi:hypothetical protein